MSSTLVTTHRVSVEAPDGAAALELERTLVDLSPIAVWRRGTWVVDIPAVRDLDELRVILRRWLRDVGAEATAVHVDDERTLVRLERADRHRSTNADFIG